ncbi:hypothetical protein [Gallaecimonas sp. GXIMD4217]|uniref:hypothetical protein n=1 Tax=Gallaecimonas sp. GXIMD4217 TaxID=3131927 RepID=UPI00311B0A42
MLKYLLVLLLALPGLAFGQELDVAALKAQLPKKIDEYIQVLETGNFEGKEALFFPRYQRERKSFPRKWQAFLKKMASSRQNTLAAFKYIKQQKPAYFSTNGQFAGADYFNLPAEFEYRRIRAKLIDGTWYLN